jgi:hypothetical protein
VVRVERVTVEAGGQAIVGAVAREGGGSGPGSDGRPHAPAALAHEPGVPLRGGSPCRSPAVRGRRRCRMHGGAAGSGARAGNRNALRHGGRTAEAQALRRLASGLAREVRRARPAGWRRWSDDVVVSGPVGMLAGVSHLPARAPPRRGSPLAPRPAASRRGRSRWYARPAGGTLETPIAGPGRGRPPRRSGPRATTRGDEHGAPHRDRARDAPHGRGRLAAGDAPGRPGAARGGRRGRAGGGRGPRPDPRPGRPSRRCGGGRGAAAGPPSRPRTGRGPGSRPAARPARGGGPGPGGPPRAGRARRRPRLAEGLGAGLAVGLELPRGRARDLPRPPPRRERRLRRVARDLGRDVQALRVGPLQDPRRRDAPVRHQPADAAQVGGRAAGALRGGRVRRPLPAVRRPVRPDRRRPGGGPPRLGGEQEPARGAPRPRPTSRTT